MHLSCKRGRGGGGEEPRLQTRFRDLCLGSSDAPIPTSAPQLDTLQPENIQEPSCSAAAGGCYRDWEMEGRPGSPLRSQDSPVLKVSLTDQKWRSEASPKEECELGGSSLGGRGGDSQICPGRDEFYGSRKPFPDFTQARTGCCSHCRSETHCRLSIVARIFSP